MERRWRSGPTFFSPMGQTLRLLHQELPGHSGQARGYTLTQRMSLSHPLTSCFLFPIFSTPKKWNVNDPRPFSMTSWVVYRVDRKLLDNICLFSTHLLRPAMRQVLHCLVRDRWIWPGPSFQELTPVPLPPRQLWPEPRECVASTKVRLSL